MLLIKQTSLFLTLSLIAPLAAYSQSAKPGVPHPDDVLVYPATEVIDFASGQYSGKSMLYTQRNIIKPILDRYARDGFTVASGDDVLKALDQVSSKVRNKILSRHKREQLAAIADALHAQGPISFLDMPAQIAKIDRAADRYNLPTFFALVSGGGAALRFAQDNFAYNVNYAIGARAENEKKPGYDPKAVQTGRSFGMGPGSRAGKDSGPNDVSDEDHLNGLQNLVQADLSQGLEMTRTIIQGTGNSDFSNYSHMGSEAQTLTSDYFAVYTAEQVRNLMDKSLSTQSWDVSLMEVTLLSVYYANLKEIWVIYQDKYMKVPLNYTNEVFHQWPKATEDKTTGITTVVWKRRAAGFKDYWQRSNSPSATSADLRESRSGINITRPQFRMLGKYITEWEMQNNPGVVKKVAELLGSSGANLYEELSSFFINEKAPDSFDKNLINQLADAFVDFQAQVAKDAPSIHAFLQKRLPKFELKSQVVITGKRQSATKPAPAQPPRRVF